MPDNSIHPDTNSQFKEALKRCRNIFARKLQDYGPSWRIMRPAALTDQLLIKAKRIRTLETTGVSRVGEGKDINEEKVTALAAAADACWEAILRHDLDAFAEAYLASFKAQTAMFPGMVNPSVNGELCKEASVQPYIDRYSALPEVLAWKMPGAGGGGYLVLVVKDAKTFSEEREEAIEIHIRRQ